MSERPVAIGLFREAVLRFGEGKTTIASRLADRARELFLAAGDLDGACAAALLRGRAALRAARYAEAAEWLQWARDEGNRRGLAPRVLAATSELAVLSELQGDLKSAVAAHRAVLEQQRAREDNLGIAMAAGNVARLLPRVAGHLPHIVAESRGLLDEALQRFRDGPHEPGIANSLICIGDLDRAAGRLDEALALFHEVVGLPATGGVQPMRLLALHNAGNVLRQMGDYRRALEAYEQAAALAVTLGDVRSARRARLSLAMTEAMTGAVRAAQERVFALRGDLVGSDDDGARAIIDLNESGLYLAQGFARGALWTLQDAERHYEARADAVMLQEVQLARASLALVMRNDRRAVKEARRRESASPSVARERLLLRAQVAFRSLELAEFDQVIEKLGQAESWQEAVGISALCVERAALSGMDATAGLNDMLALTVPRGAAVDRVTMKLAQANALAWLGDLPRAVELADEAHAESTALGREFLTLRSHVVRTFACGLLPPTEPWQQLSTVLTRERALVPAALAGALTALGQRDDAALDLAIRALHDAGDERHKLFVLTWRASIGSPELARAGVIALQNAGLFVPPWLLARASNRS